MALYTRGMLRDIYRQRPVTLQGRAAEVILREASAAHSPTGFDVFLSHAFLDKEEVVAIKVELEKQERTTVYVDWVEDPQLERSRVTPKTADALRSRMRQCRSLVYAATANAKGSTWMPWELGFFDAFRGRVAVLPVTETPVPGDSYTGQEYLGLYPYIVETSGTLYVHREASKYVGFRRWLAGADP